ncbi:MAG: hypothetical protein JST22_09955 [Bacteroidetes bacterium]|nr:hypothetical protein [Bacteroidota bacterium]
MADLETTIRQELGIPDNAQHVLILSMDAHMDWDWEVTFQDYLEGVPNTFETHSAVTEIIDNAFSLMSGSGPAPSTYYYSVCEMGFFEGAIQLNPSLLDNFATDIGDRLRIVGGGVTSPDNLLPHGEALVRNYLIGKTWMQQTFNLPLRQAYVPDDFGNDSQFPVLLEAMGLEGVSFSRIPGAPNQGPPASYGNNQSLNNTLVADGVDFVWQAADGSSTIAHYMQQTYCQGNGINNWNNNCSQNIQNNPAFSNIQCYIDINQPSAPTPYIYVPCGCDFALPISNLVTTANDWNNQFFTGAASDVYVVVATLDHYIQLISTYIDQSVQHNYGPYKYLQPTTFFPTPYWTGYYASRIRNKILHQAATRALLGAETFGAIADLLQAPDAFGFQWLQAGRSEAIGNGWKGLVPSTHHDYISGTAPDGVYTTEQAPLLAGVLNLGAGARGSAMAQIAQQVAANPAAGQTPIVVFNQLGFNAGGPTILPENPNLNPQSVKFEDGSESTVQITHDGDYLFIASAPSLGYQAGYLSNATVTPSDTASITTPDNGATYVLSNGALTATIASSLNWGIAYLVDNTTNIDMISSTGTGNDLVFYIDQGGIYRFGNEYNDGDQNFRVDPNGTLTAVSAEVLEQGPLRVWLRTTVEFNSTDGTNKISGTYTRDYILVAGEPYLRISFTGAAPLTASGAPNSNTPWEGNQYAVMAQFPFGDPNSGNQVTIDAVSYGTPNHWIAQMPEPYWPAPIFQAMHNMAVVGAAGTTLGAVYQSTIPAWAVDAQGAFIGCLLRNTPQDQVDSHGANGQDTETHTHQYAIRVPSGINALTEGTQLQESLAFSTPLRTLYASLPIGTAGLPTGKFPATFSLASASPSSAIITAAKPGTLDSSALVFRVYQPSNDASGVAVTITLADQVSSQKNVTAQLVTALEDVIAGTGTLPISKSAVQFTMQRAIATLQVGPPAPQNAS